MLAAGSWPQEPQLLTKVLMKSLDNCFIPFKSDFALNSTTYLDMSLDNLEQCLIKWAESSMIMVDPSASALMSAACAAASTPGSSSAAPTYPMVDDIKSHCAGNKCPCCGGFLHLLENCHPCQKGGYFLTFDTTKAQEKLSQSLKKKKKKGADAGNFRCYTSSSSHSADYQSFVYYWWCSSRFYKSICSFGE